MAHDACECALGVLEVWYREGHSALQSACRSPYKMSAAAEGCSVEVPGRRNHHVCSFYAFGIMILHSVLRRPRDSAQVWPPTGRHVNLRDSVQNYAHLG